MKELKLHEAVCLVAGAGIGGGVMAIPLLVSRVGLGISVLTMLVAFLVTLVLHIMVAELSIQTDYASELLTVFSKHLFGEKPGLRTAFYCLMAVTLVCNLAAYVVGAGDILADLLRLPSPLAYTLFFGVAAVVVALGLKHIALNETVALAGMLLIVALMASATILLPVHQALPPTSWQATPLLSVYGMAMFCFSSLFAVPQAAKGLHGDKRQLTIAVSGGLLINLVVTVVITACTLLSSEQVTEVAFIGWGMALPGSLKVLGSVFIVLAMLTTFWSISLQLSDMTRSFLKRGRLSAWLVATVPSYLIALLPISGFLALVQIAGGATAVVVALMAVPAYINATRGQVGLLLGGIGSSRVLAGCIIVMYLLMAVGSLM